MSTPFMADGVVLLFVLIIGMIGNVAAMIVFSNRRLLQRKFHALMLSLSVFDLVSLLNIFFLNERYGM